jgi:dTDP-4-dehydrorhamnose reductase
VNHRPNTLLIGKNGQVGHDILPKLEKVSKVTAVDRAMLDLTRPDDIRQVVRSVRPDVIVNAAAYTAVDKAESERALAEAINARAPEVLAQEASQAGSLLVHYSTDYVFDGTKLGPYTEEDPVCPINTYGKTKANGEEAIRRTGCRHLIFRTSWVFSGRGTNFLLTMLKLGRARDQLRIVHDQIGAPTSSEALARATVEVLQQVFNARGADENLGTYHLTAGGETSWFGFAGEIFQQASPKLLHKVPQLHAIPTSEYPTPARRPLNSSLSCEKLRSKFGVVMPHWRDCLAGVLAVLSATEESSRCQSIN